MAYFFNKKKDVELTLEPVDKQAIPYACHYDDKTLLTKNGELFQVLKLEGYSKEIMNSAASVDLRAIIREAITNNITDRRVALWFHTIRRKRNLDSINYFSSTFSKDTHDSWAKKNYWRDKFVNELYVTIIYEGNSHGGNALSFTPKLLKQYYSKKLDENSKKLDAIVLKMLDVLKVYGGKRLEVQHDSMGAHSEILEFLSKIICLHSKRVAVPLQSIDNVFSNTKIAFGGNTLEVLDEHKKHFAAVFSIKEYHEFAAKALDKFMGISTEYIISQTLNFIDSKEAKKSFEYFNYILGVSKDSDLKTNCGLEDIINSGDNQTDYGIQQMNFMIIDDSLEKLQNSVFAAIKELNKLGIVIIREDLNIELCFWSQLPGNFKFFRRSSYINTNHSASFASLNNNPSGKTENIWGSAVTLFRRADGGPHFFNFHIDNVGHTIISGPPESSKKTLLNFLLSESTKYKPDILYIDQNMSSKVFIKAIEGRYEILNLEQEKPPFSFNPFSLPDNPKNHQFLKDWFLFLIFPENDYSDDQKQLVYAILDVFLEKVPTKNRQISILAEAFEDQNIREKLKLWCRPNKLGRLFDNSMDEFDNGTKIIGLNIDVIAKNNFHAAQAAILYSMYKFSTINNNEMPRSPTIIAIDDANLLLQGDHFANMLPNWLNDLTINNAMAILVCDIDNEINPNIININDNISTHLLLPTFDYKLYKNPFQINNQEIDLLKTMRILHRNFMIKHKEFTMIVELNLDGLDYAIAALNGEQFAIEAMDKAIKENGENPNVWILPFYQNLFPNTKE